MKILILGGHGFVGSALFELLRATGYSDISRRSRRNGLDLTNYESVRNVLGYEKPDLIYHCAAYQGGMFFLLDHQADAFKINSEMALNLYDAVSFECPEARIINPLSACAYPGSATLLREQNWLNGEPHPTVYGYASSKRVLYATARSYEMQHGIKTTNFLVPNLFGPGDTTDEKRAHALSGLMIRMIRAKRDRQYAFEVWGSGRPVREWCYIYDAAEILMRAAALDIPHPTNIAQNHGATIHESAEAIKYATQYKGSLWFNHNTPDGAPKKVLDDTRFRVLFPNFKFTPHDTAIARTASYYEGLL